MMDDVPDKTKTPYLGGEPIPGTFIELVYRPERSETAFAIYTAGHLRYQPTFEINSKEVLRPYSARNSLVENKIVLFASAAEDYETTASLVQEIRSFIHRYVTISVLFETIAAHYVLMTWIYEGFSTLPYLRARGEFGSGKTRFLTVIGSLCFRPIFASGASTVSPLFRMLNIFRGTLILDEGDFRLSDEKAELTKILNNGNSRGFPVLRSESRNGREYSPAAYDVFGPKVIATRGYYQDHALESRFISEDMTRNEPRSNMPLHLPESFDMEARCLRNKLLMFRFRNLRHYSITDTTNGTTESRINQVFAPLVNLAVSDNDRQAILDLIRDYSYELSLDRTVNIEGYVVSAIQELWTREALPLKAITARLNEKYRAEFQEVVSGKRVGHIIRKTLQIRTRKQAGVFEILPTEHARLESLFRRFGLKKG